MSPRKRVHHLAIDRAYLRELYKRVTDGPGLVAVARAAGLHRTSVYRTLSGGDTSRHPTLDVIEAIRAALARLEPGTSSVPPPVVAVRGRDHHAWITISDTLSADELARAAKDPALVTRALKRGRPTKKARR